MVKFQNLFVQISVELSSRKKPLKVMITGAPASGKGTQCELIVKHVSNPNISLRLIKSYIDE